MSLTLALLVSATLVQHSRPMPAPVVPLGTIRSWIPADLRPKPMPRALDNGWELAMHASGRPKVENDLTLAAQALEIPPEPRRASEPNVDSLLRQWGKKPSPETVVQAEAAFAIYEPRLRFLRAAVARPAWVAPRASDAMVPGLYESVGPSRFSQYAGLKELGKVLVLRSRYELHRGNPEAAADALVLAKTAGERLSGGNLITHLVGVAMISFAFHEIRALVSDERVPLAIVERVAKNVETSASTNSMAEVLKNEIHDERIRMIAALPDPAKCKPEDLSMTLEDLKALAGVNLFDRKGTVELSVPIWREEIANLSRPWSDRKDVEQLASKLIGPVPEELLGGPEKPTPARKRQLIAAMKKTPNLLGRSVLQMFVLGESVVEADFRHRAAWQATRAWVGLRVHELRKGKPATSLDQLVSSRILASVPADPFGDGPLRYEAKNRRVWSVGPDGKDHGGDAKEKRDLVYSAN